MSSSPVISALGYVSLQTTDLGASVANATEALGLREVANRGTTSHLAAQDVAREIVYTQSERDALDHVGLIAADADAVMQIRERVDRAGYRIVSESPLEETVESGFAFVGPEGFTWQIFAEPAQYSIKKTGGFGPDRFGHVNVQVTDPLAQRDFLVDVLDFRVSDQIGTDAAFFLRCNNDHHGIAVFKSERTGLHHHAWQTQNITDLGRLGDRLARRGARLAWGPVRHGAGDNIAVYYIEPTGAVIELYTDMELIQDPARPARLWDEDDLYWINQWDGQVPSGILDHGIPPIER
ncbi:hypothetical protein ASD65_11035 [Microbacterium sp. Root61]|uniref:VOC family protein n=1 Tax=Microbacterium sp. Root61 TaxID=1736570 RepID=UPI0006FBE043|nr:VOC family protein [Microbacterium sp. Root61]KRA24901.1 hypothetical protein ASD65_11035 [Microbacterium sp. Root61]